MSKVIRISNETEEKLKRNKEKYEKIFEGKIKFKDEAIIKAALDTDYYVIDKAEK